MTSTSRWPGRSSRPVRPRSGPRSPARRWTSSPATTSGCSPARSGCVRRGRWTSGRSSASTTAAGRRRLFRAPATRPCCALPPGPPARRRARCAPTPRWRSTPTYRDWMGFTAADCVLGVAPLFHITGLIGHVGIAMLAACPLVLSQRFEPRVVIGAIREHQPTFTIGSVTVFISLSGLDGVTREDWSSFRMIYSGGAPIAPAITDQFMEKTGLYLRNIYGLTENNSPSHAVPLGKKAPVDPNSGALSVGVPVFGTVVPIIDEAGLEVPVGQTGEIVTSGPQVIPGHWNRLDATAESLPGGELRTGDVGFMDEDGWCYLVDRKKDMINAAGCKVRPPRGP